MSFRKLLKQNREALVEKWFKSIMSSYPSDSVKVLSRKSDRFQNPMGYHFNEGVNILFDEIVGEMNGDNINRALDAILRIRSVQEFSPSEAVKPILSLKNIVRDHLKTDHSTEISEINDRIDQVLLSAFDNFSSCRENIYELKIREAKSGSIKLIDRLNRKPNEK